MIHSVLQQDHLLETIFCFISVCEFDESGIHVCNVRFKCDPDPFECYENGCMHTHSLMLCALVSRRWSHLALKVLWGDHAHLSQLINLLPPSQGLSGDVDKGNNTVCLPFYSYQPRSSR